jgi:hypothetical protein
MRETSDRGVVYTPDAEVGHKVFAWRTDTRWLLERSFWQGYSKRAMESLVSADSSAEESAFLNQLLIEFVPRRVKGLLTDPSGPKAKQLGTVFMLTATIGCGYLYGVLTWD